MRVSFVLAIFVLLAGSMLSTAGGAVKPNVIVIFTDDHGYADLSCQGVFNDVKTPHIDSLATGGVRMTSGYVTAPQCVPSRAGLLTGQYQTRFGLDSNSEFRAPGGMDGFNNALTIAERLKKAGYATGMTGKWHLGPKEKIVQHGFDDVFYKNGRVAGWANYDLEGNDVKPGPENCGLYHLEANAAAACAFIKRHHDEPFFFYCAFRAPHVPLDATEKYLKRFPGEMPERRRKAIAMLSAVDDGVGSILKTLRKYDIEENTLIFFIGDNGAPLKIYKTDAPGIGAGWNGSLNDPLNGEKGTVIEGGNRVPFVVYWKGRIPGRQVYDHPVISLDVAATAVELAGLGKSPQLDGVNLVPYLTGKKKGAPHEALYWRWTGQAAIREGKWKYIQGESRRYLFNLETDIEEKQNLVEKHPEIASRLEGRLAKWSEQLDPPGLDHPVGGMGNNYFDYYLDDIEASHPKYPSEATEKKSSRAGAGKRATPARGKRPTAEEFFNKRDSNKDGRLTLDEYIMDPINRNVPVLTQRFKSLDKDGDGFLNRSELE